MNSLFSILYSQAQKKLKKVPQPTWVDPMLATLTDQYFSSNQWLYERKWDGERILAYKTIKSVQLFTRNKKSANSAYPHIVAALEQQPIDTCILDGEVIALHNKQSSFEQLQLIMHDTQVQEHNKRIVYCVFDILYLNGYDTRELTLIDRKKLLDTVLMFNHPIEYTEHVLGNGIQYYSHACKKHWEGVIAKDILSNYSAGRSKKWLKFKCSNQQELVIGGFTDPKRSRTYFGALLVGYYQNNKLIYAGKVGTGFTQEVLRTLGMQLQKLIQDTSPFSNTHEIQRKNVHWVRPVFVAEIAFSSWTGYNKLRHPRYRGLRRDKDPHDVIQEKPEPAL